MHIGLHRETRGGQGAFLGDHIGAVEAEAIGQNQPALDAAHFFAQPVVIVDARNPFAAQCAIVGARHQGGVLARHGVLIAIAVERPGLHLPLVHLAAMQHLMEHVLVVIALGADRADRGFNSSGVKNASVAAVDISNSPIVDFLVRIYHPRQGRSPDNWR